MPANIKWECYLCTRSQHGSLRVSHGEENWFLPLWKLIFTTMETFFFSPRKFFYHFNILQTGEIQISKEAQCNGIQVQISLLKCDPAITDGLINGQLQWAGRCLQNSMILFKLIFTTKTLIFTAMETVSTTVEIDFYHHGGWFLPPWNVFLNGSELITLT